MEESLFINKKYKFECARFKETIVGVTVGSKTFNELGDTTRLLFPKG